MKICTRIANTEQQKYLSLCDFCSLRDNNCPECESCNVAIANNRICKHFISKFALPLTSNSIGLHNYIIFDWYRPLTDNSINPQDTPYITLYYRGFIKSINDNYLVPSLLRIVYDICSNNVISSKIWNLNMFEYEDRLADISFSFQSCVESSKNIFILTDIRNTFLQESTYLIILNKDSDINVGNSVKFFRIGPYYSNTGSFKLLRYINESTLIAHTDLYGGYVDDQTCIINFTEEGPQGEVSNLMLTYIYGTLYSY